MNTVKQSQTDLTESARRAANPTQLDMLERMLKLGWKVKAIYKLPRTVKQSCIVFDAPHVVAALYPHGHLERSKVGAHSITINALWAGPSDKTR